MLIVFCGLAVIFFLVPMVLGILWAYTMPYWQAEAVESMEEIWNPDAGSMALTLERMRGGWPDQMKERVPLTLSMQTTVFMSETVWRVISMMLLGMFLLKREVLTARLSQSFYIRMSSDWTFLGLALIGRRSMDEFSNGVDTRVLHVPWGTVQLCG